MILVVCVIVIQGLLVGAYPTGQYDADSEAVYVDDMLEQVPVQGVAEFSGTVPVSGSVTIVGGCGCPPPLPMYESLQTLPENDDYIETCSLCKSKLMHLENDDSDNSDNLSKTAQIGSLLADSILAGKEAEMEAKFVEIDSFVETELEKIDSLVNSVLTEIDAAVNSDLQKIETEIASGNLNDIESEPTKIDELVELALVNNVTPLNLDLSERKFETQISAEREQFESVVESELEKVDSLIESELANVDLFLESELKKTEAIIKSELEKVNSLVETELAVTEALIESELEKVDSFVDSELLRTEALIQSELSKVNSLVESELAKTEAFIESELRKVDLFVQPELETVDAIVPVAGVAEFSGVVPASGRTIIYGRTECDPSLIFPIIEENGAEFEPETIEVPLIDNVEFIGTVPVTGRTLIFGSTGSLEPNLDLLEANPFIAAEKVCESVPVSNQFSNLKRNDHFPLFESGENIPETKVFYDDSLSVPNDTDYDTDLETVPVVGEAVFRGVTPASGYVKIVGSTGCPPLFPLKPPTVGNADQFIKSQDLPDSESNGYLWLARKENDQYIPDTEGVISQINVLPMVNVLKKHTFITEDGDTKEIAIVEGNLEVSGTARATGRAILVNKFECAPLMPTAETTDGRKWLWLAEEPSNKAISAPASKITSDSQASPMIEFPISTYPTDFPETVIMDSTKNYERLLDDYGDEDIYEQAIPVAGEVHFEGIAPAFGSVSIRGRSAY